MREFEYSQVVNRYKVELIELFVVPLWLLVALVVMRAFTSMGMLPEDMPRLWRWLVYFVITGVLMYFGEKMTKEAIRGQYNEK